MLSLQNTYITVADIAEIIHFFFKVFHLTFETSSHCGLRRRRGIGMNLFFGRIDIPDFFNKYKKNIKKMRKLVL